MSKRTASTKNEDASKRPKIEYQLFNSQTWSQHKKELAQQPQPPKHDPFWFDDDDDDFIIIASQKVENQLQNSTNLDMTYGKFNGNVGVSSTQVQPSTSKAAVPPATTARTNNQDIASLKKDIEDMKEHFNGDFDDDFFTDAGKEETVDDDPPFSATQFKRDEPKPQKQPLASGSNQQNGFKVPLAPVVVKPPPKPVVKPPPVSRPSTSTLDQSKVSRQKEHAKDLQISFLQKQIASYMEKNTELQKTATENTEKLQNKEGEVSMIRYELNNLKKLNENLRMDKLSEKETIKNEWTEKMNELEKQIRAQKAQLDLKDMEMMKTKRKSLNQSVRDESSMRREASARLRIYISNIVLSDSRVVMNANIFEPVTTELKTTRRHSPSEVALRMYMTNFQTLLSMMKAVKDPNAAKETAEKMFDNAKSFIFDLQRLSKDLTRIKHADPKLISALEYNFLCENTGKNAIAYCPNHLADGLSIDDGEKMFTNERAQAQRRILAAVAIACENSPTFCHKIATAILTGKRSADLEHAINGDVIVLSDDEDDEPMRTEEAKSLEIFLPTRCRSDDRGFLDLLNETLTEISYSKELFDYCGIVVASTEILTHVIRQCSVDWESRKQLRSILNLLKTIVFCRCDNLYAVHAISKLLCQTSADAERRQLLNYLCTNTANGAGLLDDSTHNIVQFSKDSCVLQVFGAILEVSVSPFRQLNRLESQLLFKTVLNVTEFLRSSLTCGAEWTTRFLQTTGGQQCQCYKRMVYAFVVLLHLLFKAWLSPGKRDIEDGWMRQAVRSGVLLLYDILKKNYVHQLLMLGSSNTIKTCLQVLFSWMRRYSVELGLQAMHERALSLIDLNMFIPDLVRINEEANGNRMEEQMLIESFAIL